MFKELLATVLVSASLSGAPTKEAALPSTSMFGAYCFKEYENYSTLANALFNMFSGANYEYNYNYETSGYSLFMYFNNDNRFYSVKELTLSVDSFDGIFNIEATSLQDDEAYFNVQNQPTLNQDFTDYSNDVRRMIIYFNEYTQLDRQTYDFLHLFFDDSGSSEVEVYTGWYTFGNNNANTVELMGNITANNSMYNFMGVYQNAIDFYYKVGEQYNSFQLYNFGTWKAQKNIFMNAVMIPSNLKAYLLQKGTFAYMPNTSNSTFQDLFYTLADTPVYYITTWFNFDLLGFNFGVAIISLLTVLVIAFVIKKLV